MKKILLGLAMMTFLAMPVAAQTRVRSMSSNVGRLDLSTLMNTDQTTVITRYFLAGYNTLCLPMTLTAEQLAACVTDLKVERLAGIGQEGSDLMLYFVDCSEEGIKAGEPYLVYSPTDQFMKVRSNKAESLSTDLKEVEMSDAAGNTVRFGGSWESVLENGRYGIPAKQDVTPLESVLIRTVGDKAFLPTRCGFVWDRQSPTASNLKIQHVKNMDELTLIQSVNNGNGSVDVYDVRGMLVKRGATSKEALNGLPQGIYVVGGEKVLVK